MSEQENQKPTLIPPNFIEKGKIFGGMFDIRNAIEGGVIAALITYPVLQLPFSVTVRIIILCMTTLPLFMISLIGIGGMSITAFLGSALLFIKDRRIIYRSDKIPDAPAPKQRVKSRSKEPKPKKTKKKRRSARDGNDNQTEKAAKEKETLVKKKERRQFDTSTKHGIRRQAREDIRILKYEKRQEKHQKIQAQKAARSAQKQAARKERQDEDTILSRADLTLSYTKEEYKERLKKLQKKIQKLHGELYRRRIPVVLGFEGWDAGGKGGAIKRLTQKMDPRGYVVHPTASPNDIERAHHYLWRFWIDMPKAGHVTIFDRTWYGRVMVERIEGFCSRGEWQRAYKEINDMERDLTDAGAIVLKFWMQIDKDEQERRFRAREENPEKRWKITDEDWRNRAKWDQYEEAVNEMLLRTSTPNAPWIVVEGNCKYYARIKVLETVCDAIEARIREDDGDGK